MESLWEKVQKGLSEGLDAAKSGISTFLDKTGDITQIARLRISIIGLQRKIRDNFFEMGGRIYELVSKGEEDVLKDKEIKKLIKEVKALEKEIHDAEKEIEKIKKEGKD
ncbi:MAG TPA: hypothetical protein ENG29_01365 [Firmicutes bacterium]|nr:MAG: hypothetical protein DRH51_06875 [Candidatus Coatesbacteria bacterium]RLC44829.1 MAG: hypothetical protein DRH44_01095 [Candidatus Coatesbacteria bacterium]HDM43018.1 hypothetical protein [Bacillota bacterium]